MEKRKIGIYFNSPVILTFCFICLASLVVGTITKGKSTTLLFSVYRSSPINVFTYVRLFGHIFGHAGWDHFFNNITMILVIGPMLEEKYGAKNIMLVITFTALATGLIHIIFFPNTMLLGASGVVFAFILMAPLTGVRGSRLPLTFIIVAAVYIGGQIYQGIFVQDNISNLTHIIGGLVGATGGYAANMKRRV